MRTAVQEQEETEEANGDETVGEGDEGKRGRAKTTERGVVGARVDLDEEGRVAEGFWASYRMPDMPPLFGLPLGYLVMGLWSFLIPTLVILTWK